MRGSIRKRSENSWSIRYDGPPGPNGRRTQKEEAVRGTKRDAERLLRKRQTEVEAGVYVDRSPVTLQQYLDEWLENYGRTNVRPRTLYGYRQKMRSYVFGKIGNIKLIELRPEHVEGVYSEMIKRGLSPTTVLQVHRILHRALVLAVRSQRLNHNPLDMVTPPRIIKSSQPMWSVEQMRIFLDAVEGHRYQEFYELALYTGLRRSELAGLTWENIDLAGGRLQVVVTLIMLPGVGPVVSTPKTERSRRRVSLRPEAVTILHRLWDKQESQRVKAWGHVARNRLRVHQCNRSANRPGRGHQRILQYREAGRAPTPCFEGPAARPRHVAAPGKCPSQSGQRTPGT